MRHNSLFLSRVFAVATVLGLVSESSSREVSLPPLVEKVLRTEIAPQWVKGNSLVALQKLSSLLPRIDDAQMAAVDEWLKQAGLPSAGSMIVETRLMIVQQGFERNLPKAQPREIRLIHEEVARRAAVILSEARARPAMQRPLPKPPRLADYEDLLYQLRMLAQAVDGAVQMAKYDVGLVPAKTARTAPDNPSAQRLEELQNLRREIDEQQVALRLQRFVSAADIVATRDEFKDRLIAAGAVDEDGEWLLATLQADAKARRQYALAELQGADLAGAVAMQLATVRATAGDLLEKSRLLRLGVQWWIRGRYGRGPEGFGLLKSELALASPAAQLALFMPPELPQPNDSASAEISVPQFDRRHHYIWLFEYRQVMHATQRAVTASGQTIEGKYPWHVPVGIAGRLTEWTVVTQSLTPSDNRQVSRLVGFLEYQNALTNFDSLVRISNASEVEVYDELLRDRPELTVFTNLTRRFAAGHSSLNEAGDPSVGWERQGLRWVTALARLELAAMLAAFTSLENPFEVAAVGTYDGEQYRALLLDGARCHYWALHNDPMLRVVMRDRSLNQNLLRYARRVELARAMLIAAARGNDYSPVQYEELKTWYDRLTAVDAKLNGIIQANLLAQQVDRVDLPWAAGGTNSDVKLGLKFENWPYDRGYHGINQGVIRMSAGLK
jgi:hypothetical protein